MNEHTDRTQDRITITASRGLQGVREAAQRDKGLRFTTLLHHVNEKRLLDSFYLLKKQAAPGVVTRGEEAWSALSRTRSAFVCAYGQSHGASMRRAWSAASRISTTGFIGERTGRSRHGESTFRNRMGGNDH